MHRLSSLFVAWAALLSPVISAANPVDLPPHVIAKIQQMAEGSMGVSLEELQERWDFPSDHLPIGATVDGLKIVSWNVLNTEFLMNWIGSQGLSRSALAVDNVAVNSEGLTRRDEKAIDKILEMIEKGRHLICLQECGTAFIRELERRLPESFALALRLEMGEDREAALYDTRILSLEENQRVVGVYSAHPNRMLMDVLFKRLDTGVSFHLINVHVPGDYDGPGRDEIARYIASCSGQVIALGDYNFNEQAMRSAFSQAEAQGTLLSPYCTNICPILFRSKCIDHIYLSPGLQGSSDATEEILAGLQQIAALLNPVAVEAMGVYVGELQERWTFPSDHMPIGAAIDGLKIASWNVLNAKFLTWVGGQGLSRSSLTEDNVAVNSEGLTRRDEKVIGKILEMIEKGRHLICLQECSEAFNRELERRLPESFALTLRSRIWAHDQESIVYDTRILSLEEKRSVQGIYSVRPKRPIMDVRFKRLDTGSSFRLLNLHVPGDHNGPARGEIARYIAACSGPVIALGDYNFNELLMRHEFSLAGAKGALLSPYCTNISPSRLWSKCIDHIYLSPELRGSADAPEEVLSGLQNSLDLLESGPESVAFCQF